MSDQKEIIEQHKKETLLKVIGLQNNLDKAHTEIKRLDKEVKEVREEHRKAHSQTKRTLWEISKIITGHKTDILEHSHRITDTEEHLTDLQKIISWTCYTLIGLLITTVIGGLIKLVFSV